MTSAASVLLMMLAFSASVAFSAALRLRPIVAAVALVPGALIAVCVLALV